MASLLFRCVAPMQSWGSRSRFEERDTEREPTKSGITGLICAALGRDRAESLDDLIALRLGVRVDREGVVDIDYHTALNVVKASGAGCETQLSRRAYLADAAFLAGVEGDVALLERIHGAFRHPVWPLFFGRRSFPPGEPVYLEDGLAEKGIQEALAHYPCIAPWRRRASTAPPRVRLVLECLPGEDGDERRDVPVSFDHAGRRFASRRVRTLWIDAPRKGEESEDVSESLEL
jgi:CRISPR system Cascade subunit CasD